MTQQQGFDPTASSSYIPPAASDAGAPGGALFNLNALMGNTRRELEMAKTTVGLLKAQLPTTQWTERVSVEQQLAKADGEVTRLTELSANLEKIKGFVICLRAIYSREIETLEVDSPKWRAAKIWLAKCG